MQISYIFTAFSEADIQAMANNHRLVNEYTQGDEERAELRLDVEYVGYEFLEMLQALHFPFADNDFLDNVIENGGYLISVNDTKKQSIIMSNWTKEYIENAIETRFKRSAERREYVDELEDPSPMYLEQLVDFYKSAAEQNFGVVHYALT